MRSAVLVAIAFAGAGCGNPHLSNLRCATDPCEDTADPFLERLMVDFTDPGAELTGGTLDLFQDDKLVSSIPIDPLLPAQGATKGTLLFDFHVRVASFSDGHRYWLGVMAKGKDTSVQSNRPTMEFVLHVTRNP